MAPVRGKLLDDRVQQLVRPANLRKRFVAVGVSGSGELILKSHKGHLLRVTVRNALPLIARDHGGGDLRHVRPFERWAGSDRGYQISRATWADGSQAFLDSRGLLHLRSADRSIAEVTLVMAEGELTGWCADGRRWGRPYFVGKDRSVVRSVMEQRSIYESTIRKFVACIDA